MGHRFPEALARKFAAVGEIKTFIETGTYKGDTALKAAKIFPQVVTVEADPDRFQKTLPRLFDNDHINPILGDTREKLPTLLQVLAHPVLFWLDAHWCGGGAEAVHEKGGDECPLMEELAAIRTHSMLKYDIILIDDARLFLQPPPQPHDPAQWPSFATVKAFMPDFVTLVRDDIICMVHQSNPAKGVMHMREWF